MRIISVTPAGRRRYLRLLVPHLLRNRDLIHEHHWWLNTDVPHDEAYIRGLCHSYPDFFKLCEQEPLRDDRRSTYNLWKFWQKNCDPNTLYLRFDDDIIWMADDAVERLIQFRLGHRDPPLVMANIVNNAVCTHFHQAAGLLPTTLGTVQKECMCSVGWKSGRVARQVHHAFLTDLEAGRADRWRNVAIPLECGERFSINVISWFGETFASLEELYHEELYEEEFVTEELPRKLGHANLVCAQALFAHYAFFTQRPYLDATSSDLLERYQAVAEGSTLPADYWHPVRDMAWTINTPLRWLSGSVKRRLKLAA